MVEILENILNFFTTIINFIITMITGIVQMFSMLGGIQLFMAESVSYLPSFLAPFFILGVSLLIVKLVVDLI